MVMLTEDSYLFILVGRYIEGAISANELQDWLVPRLESFIDSPKPSVKQMVGVVELGLAELSLGHLTEDEFRARLRASMTSMATVIDMSGTGEVVVHNVSTSPCLELSDSTPQFSYTEREEVSA